MIWMEESQFAFWNFVFLGIVWGDVSMLIKWPSKETQARLHVQNNCKQKIHEAMWQRDYEEKEKHKNMLHNSAAQE